MADESTFNIAQLIQAFKAAGFPTKQDVEDIVHTQLTEFHAEMIKPEIEQLRMETTTQFQKLDKRMTQLETHISHVRDDIQGLKAELSDTPSRAEFEELKRKVNRYRPTS
jgi:DNA-binding transcriptional MerR regulator